MIGATVIAIFFIPMFYWAIETLSARMSGKGKTAVIEDQAAAANADRAGAEGAAPGPAPKEPRE